MIVRRVAMKRSFVTYWATYAILFGIGSIQTAYAQAASRKPANPHVYAALQQYGWAVPICVWPILEWRKPFCVPVSRLLKTHPFFAPYISEVVYAAADAGYRANRMTERVPEQVIQKLIDAGVSMGCVPNGKNRGAITMGNIQTGGALGATSVDRLKNACDKNIADLSPGIEVTFGSLVGAAPSTPILSLSGNEQGSYQSYYADCKAREAMNPHRKASDAASDEAKKKAEEKKKLDAAQKAREEAAKKAAEAADAQKKADDAKRAQDQADQIAQQAQNDPAATPADKQKAIADAVAAARVAQDAQVAADAAAQASRDANAASAQATKDLKDFIADNDRQDAIDDAVATFFQQSRGAVAVLALGLATGNLGGTGTASGALLGAAAALGGSVLGAYSGQDCLDENCAMSCEARARVQAIRDEIASYKKETCNLDVTPKPNDPPCYDTAGGLLMIPPVSAAALLEVTCKQHLIDGDCRKMLPGFFTGDVIDPCQGPLVMCAPENKGAVGSVVGGRTPQPRPTPTLRGIKSRPIPPAFGGTGALIWVAPPIGTR
jgi:hypothetical protein